MSLSERVKALGLGDRVVRRNPILYARARRAFEHLADASLEERERFTDTRLRHVLRAASRTAYGRRLGAGETIDEWPILEKEAIRDDPRSFMRLERFAVSARTSGTTGIPLELVRSLASVSAEQAAVDFLLRLRGVEPSRGRQAVLRADSVAVPDGAEARYWQDAGGGRRRLFSSRHLSSATAGRFADGLEEFAPDFLLAYPSSLEALCLLLEEAGRSLSIPVTLTSSEVLPPETRHLAEDVLGTQVVDLYGQAERVALAFSLRDREYFFLPGYASVELLPAAGDGAYEVVGTSLWNRSMPLVRYRTGDLVTVPGDAGPDTLRRIRHGLEPLREIEGRTSDYLVGPDGARIIGMNHIPRGVENVVRIQIVQESRELVRILVLARSGFGEHDREQIARNLAAKLPAGMRYTVEPVDRLERTPAARTPFLIIRPGVAP